jgi:hypothetical protein
MSKRHRKSSENTMLDLWRAPTGAGEAVGCLATTYTFAPGLFDEQCLARFLEVESEPNREDLAFLLERETRLGSSYAGVLIDHTQAGVSHSLRWDVLPVRIHAGKQHAKISLLAWTSHIRIIVASANLTEFGYRTNYEVAVPLDVGPEHGDVQNVRDAVRFLRGLLGFVPGSGQGLPELERAGAFLDHVEEQVSSWSGRGRQKDSVLQQLVFTCPTAGAMPAASSLRDAVVLCRRAGGSPTEAWVASPFFDLDSDFDVTTASLCKLMARGAERHLSFCVPSVGEPERESVRLAAPRSLLTTPQRYSAEVGFEVLPQTDADANRRPWHAKMMAFKSGLYSALLIGSSNFTQAGMGTANRRNAEANVLTIALYEAYSREPGKLEEIWPQMPEVEDPEAAEWLGAQDEMEEEQKDDSEALPPGFLTATYRAGERRSLVLRLDPTRLPGEWAIHSSGQQPVLVLESVQWAAQNCPRLTTVPWKPVQPPERLVVEWDRHQAFWVLNVEDPKHLPPPAVLDGMSADDMLLILAASDPGAAFRAWAKRQAKDNPFDEDLDTAVPEDLDPLRRYDLSATFLRRIRHRARVLASLRKNLQRPAWSVLALQWRLDGFVGIRPLAERLLKEVAPANGQIDEALLALADFLIVLREVSYEEGEGAISVDQFEAVYRPFLRDLVTEVDAQVGGSCQGVDDELINFWKSVVRRCQE